MLAVWSGLLLRSVTTPTILTEERARASLDILMSTPLPTHAIVLGKWWACYRRMLPLLILPALTGLFVDSAMPDIPAGLPRRSGIRSYRSADGIAWRRESCPPSSSWPTPPP